MPTFERSETANSSIAPGPENPALRAFCAWIGAEKVWAQVLIKAIGDGSRFELRHTGDREEGRDALKLISISELRNVAMFTAAGEFRPLHSSPDLRRGWVVVCRLPEELWRVIQELYPGSIADWFAAGETPPPVTNYRDFTDRQTGMYRITQLLSDEQAANVTRAVCHSRFCLKQRIWNLEGLEPDSTAVKSAIPCLEPCAMLLELARKAARIEQEPKLDVQFSRSELESALAAAEAALESGAIGEKVGNVGAALNPRRLQLLIEKFRKFEGDETGGREQND